MKRYAPTAEDTADLLHHQATVPALIWLVLLMAACAASVFEPPTPQVAANAPAAMASSAKVVTLAGSH